MLYGPIYKIFWLFMIASFLGCLMEVIWCIIRWRKLESRKGLIYGHFIPIYGIAGLLIALVTEIVKIKKGYFVLLITFLISSVVEYLSSVFQEKLLGTVSWDYSDMKLNIKGRINITYLALFSVVGIFWCKFYPKVIDFIQTLFSHQNYLYIITIITFIFMLYNCIISFMATFRQKQRRRKIKAKNKIEHWLDINFDDQKLKKIYANAIVVDKKFKLLKR